MAAHYGDDPQPTDESQIDSPWRGWMIALVDVFKGYAKVGNLWFWWRVGHFRKGLMAAGCVSYAECFWPQQIYLPPTGPPPNKPDRALSYNNPPINPPPQMEIAALRAVQTCLKYIYDDPANRTPAARELSDEKKKELRNLEKTAMREVGKRLRELEPDDVEENADKSALDKLTPKQEKLMRYLQSRDGKQAPIREAMRHFKKNPTSKTQWKSFLASVRRLNNRLEVHYKNLEIEPDRIAKTIKLIER